MMQRRASTLTVQERAQSTLKANAVSRQMGQRPDSPSKRTFKNSANANVAVARWPDLGHQYRTYVQREY